MPSEPIEAGFAKPPILSPLQEEEFRTFDQEEGFGHVALIGHPVPFAISRQSTRGSGTYGGHTPDAHLRALEQIHMKEGYILVGFDTGTGEDPREWSKARKWYVTSTCSILCLAVAIGSSIITGDMRGPTKELGSTQTIVNLTVTCFVMGFGIGPLFLSPLSEVIGRRPVYGASMFLYFIFTLPSCLAKNVATLVVARMIAGLAASAPMCNIGGSISDIWAVEERGVAMAMFSATLLLGPFHLLGVSFVLTIFIPETLAPVILHKKAKRLRKETGDDRYCTLEELERLPFAETLKIALIRPILMLFQEPIVICMTCYLTFVYSILYLLFFAFPIAFEEVRGFGGGLTGITFVSIMIGILLAGFLVPTQERIYTQATRNGTYPEARLFPMMLGAFVLPVALFIFAFTGGYSHVHWIAPCISGTLFGFAMILLYVSANSYIIDSYSNFAASAMAAKTLLRSEVAAMVPLFVNPMFHNMGFQYAGLLLALVASAIAFVPFIFFKYGERIRQRSARATQSRKIEDGQALEKTPF